MQNPKRPARPASPRSHAGLLCIIAVLMGGFVYVNALHNPFVYDDYVSVVENPSIHPPLYLRSVLLYKATRPVVNASYALDRTVWGPDPFGYHLTSVLLHMLNVGLLFLLVWRLSEDWEQRTGEPAHPRATALATALIFAIHPMMTEAVGYISGRSELLCATFFLLAMLSARRWMLDGGARWWLLSFAAWVLAMASKEIAAMFPIVLLCYDQLVLNGTTAEKRHRLLRLHAPLFGIAILGGIGRLAVLALVEHPGSSVVHWRYGLVELDVFRLYLWMMIMPTGQSIFHQIMPIDSLFTARALVALAVIAAMIAAAWYARRLDGRASLGVLWFFLLLAPSGVLVMLDFGEPMAEHRVYLAACGLLLTGGSAVGWLVSRMARARRTARMLTWATLSAAVLSLSGQTLVRNAIWSDPVALLVESVQRAPNHWRPWLLLGEALHQANRREEAIEAYKHALKLRPLEFGGHLRLAMYQAELGHFDEATNTLERLKTLDPNSAQASTALGLVSMLQGKNDQARGYLVDAVQKYPSDVPARQALAMLEELPGGSPREALHQCEEIRRLAPGTIGNEECINRNRTKLGANGSANP